MTRRAKTLAVAALATIALTACDYTMHEGGAVPPGCCNAGDTLNVTMHQYGDPAQRCDNMGGNYQAPICHDVDF